MSSFTYQPFLRPDLPQVFGPKEYREERALFIRIDEILIASGLEGEFITLAMADHGFDLAKSSAKQTENFCRNSVLALRSNIARHFKDMDHREFCTRLADSPLLQWFLQIGRVNKIKVFAKSSSDRFSRWISEAGLRSINNKLISLLSAPASGAELAPFNLKNPVSFDDIFFDSTCLKAPIHFPVDWVLLRDVTRTLMKATVLIRRTGLRQRMPQEPLEFLSDMNTLCMKMTAKNRTKDGTKHRKAVLREMKTLSKRIAKHARKHLDLLTTCKSSCAAKAMPKSSSATTSGSEKPVKDSSPTTSLRNKKPVTPNRYNPPSHDLLVNSASPSATSGATAHCTAQRTKNF